MSREPVDIKDFVKTQDWWRTKIFTELVLSEDGVGDLLKTLKERDRSAFFILDDVLAEQETFRPLFDHEEKYLFRASESEPKTGDVDRLVTMLKERKSKPDTIVGVGGGSAMDLAKAVGICIANPQTAAEYQGYELDMQRGADIWTMPTLNGTGAEVTPIAVLRGPKKKLGINNNYVAPAVAFLDPGLSAGVKKFNRFYTMMDCFFHHYEITRSKTSAKDAILDANDGLRMAKDVLSCDLSDYSQKRAIKSVMASVLGGSSTIGGRVGVSHAISYGLSNAAPKLPHSVAVTISMLACADIYRDGGYDDTLEFLRINGFAPPKARDYGIDGSHVEKMTETALGMEKLWLSHFGETWRRTVDKEFVEDIYNRIVSA